MTKGDHYPLYVVSKGRPTIGTTFRNLDTMGCDYKVIVEEQEYDEYCHAIDPSKILVLPWELKDSYETLVSHDVGRSTGSGPARNYAWQHSIGLKAKRHWVMDDNIRAFSRLNKGRHIRVRTPTFWSAMEQFVDKYTNVAMAGPQYQAFLPQNQHHAPLVFNTRIYSCNLILNAAPFHWRGRYNEDTVLSIDMLKAGWCSVLFNAWVQDKIATQTVRGGNTSEIYGDGTTSKSEMLAAVHPDVAQVTTKYGRVHHVCNYKQFANNLLIKDPDAKPIDVNLKLNGDPEAMAKVVARFE